MTVGAALRGRPICSNHAVAENGATQFSFKKEIRDCAQDFKTPSWSTSLCLISKIFLTRVDTTRFAFSVTTTIPFINFAQSRWPSVHVVRSLQICYSPRPYLPAC